MKRWAALVVFLYGLALIALTWPVAALAFVPSLGLDQINKIFAQWPYWFGVAVMMIVSAGLLFVPVRTASRRPVSQRGLWLPLLASGFLAGLLGIGLLFSIYETLVADQTKDWAGWTVLGLGGLVWLIWTVVFYRLERTADPADVVTRQCRLLLRGSILELLVAVPTHIVARCRDYCCAGFMTFTGLVFGIAVMLIAFGPGVFFLFVARWNRLHPQPGPKPGS